MSCSQDKLRSCCRRWVPGSARIAIIGATAGGKGCLQVLQLEGSILGPVASTLRPAPLKCGTFGAAGEVASYVPRCCQAQHWQVWRCRCSMVTVQRLCTAVPGRHFATGSFEGRLQTWDLDCPEQPVYDTCAHQSIVNAVDGFGGQVPAGLYLWC